MPNCPICNKPCDCKAPPNAVGSIAKPCPLHKGGIWAHILDDAGDNIKDVAVLKDGGSKKASDATGLSTYDPLEAGQYTVSLDKLSESQAKDYEPPSSSEQKVHVTDGQITYVGFELKRKGTLKVLVFQEGKPSIFIKDADIDVKGVENPPKGKTGTGDGKADFGKLKAGDYTVQVSALPQVEGAPKYVLPSKATPVTLSPGKESLVEIPVPIKQVWIKVRLQYKDDNSDVPEAAFALMKADEKKYSEPLKNGLVDIAKIDDDSYDISFPEIDADEWDAA